MIKETVGVFFGGKNPEHDVSIITGELIISGLKRLGYPVVPVFIGQDGTWYAGEKLGELRFFSAGDFTEALKGLDELTLDMEASRGKMVLKTKGWSSRTYAIDIAFPALHGRNGEDGTIQGMFEMLGVPYVGCDVASSAVSMDKALTKLMYRAEGIPTSKFQFFSKNEWETEPDKLIGEITQNLSWPLFVKPARLGSSIGIAKVRDEKELRNAVEVALHYDTKVIVEEGVEPMMDVTCSVMGHREPEASLLQESSFDKDFFSYADKYLNDGGAQLGNAKKSIMIPASLDEQATSSIRESAKRIYQLFGCSGIARVDFLYNKKTGECFANELNTMPGTLYHHLWKESGVELGDLITRLLGYAKEKHQENAAMTHTFKSEILNVARSAKLRLKGD